MRIADRIVLMRAGRIVQQGTAEELYRRPADLFAARFFCDFNEVEGVVRNGQVSTAVGVFPAPGPAGRRGGRRLHPAAGRARSGRRASACPGGCVSRRFLGEVDLVQVAVQGLDRPLQARVRDGAGASAGQDVGRRDRPERSPCFRRVPSLGWPRVRHLRRPRRVERRRRIAMGGVSIWHWLVVGLVVMLLFGRGKISEMMGDVAKGIKAFKKGMTEERRARRRPPARRSRRAGQDHRAPARRRRRPPAATERKVG